MNKEEQNCPVCKGTGVRPCSCCGGSGFAPLDSSIFAFPIPCPTCMGTRIQSCSVCKGTGKKKF